MPTALPARNIFDGTATPSTSTAKGAFGSLRDFLAGLLGTTGAAADAQTALGLVPGTNVQPFDATIVKTGQNNTFTKGQNGAYVSLTDAATIAVDLSAGNPFKVVLGGNRILGAPTNTKEGQSGVLTLYQDGTGSRTLTYAWPYHFLSGTPPTLSTAKFAKDSLAYNVDFYKLMTITGITQATPAVVTFAGHGMFSGQKCQFSALVGSTGLAAATNYWVTVIDANTFKLSSSLANCIAGTFIATSTAFTSGTLEASSITISPLLAIS